MTSPLEYEDYHPKTGQPEKVRFERICPRSSDIVKHQSGVLDYPGLAVVAHIEEDKFLDHLSNLQNINLAFTRVDKLHCTLLGLLAGNNQENANSVFKKVIYDSVKEFIGDQNLGALRLQFNCIRPGTWRHGKNKKLVNNCSDGTVIATGSMAAADNKKFCDTGSRLAEHLRNELDNIFEPDFTRKFPTLWCTLGYFDCADFDITCELSNIFNDLKKLSITLSIDQLSVFEYYSRTLEWSNRYKVPLIL
ncbi:MAG: hypothetical protein WBL68_17840 [Nitrososphaeraceae archaeon]